MDSVLISACVASVVLFFLWVALRSKLQPERVQVGEIRRLTGSELIYHTTSEHIPGGAKVCVCAFLRIDANGWVAISDTIVSCLRYAQRRHELLCSRAVMHNKQPSLQFMGIDDPNVLQQLMPIVVEEIDEPLETFTSRWCETEVNSGFKSITHEADLAWMQLCSAKVVLQPSSRSGQNAALLLCWHHLLCDGMSAMHFVAEVLNEANRRLVKKSTTRRYKEPELESGSDGAFYNTISRAIRGEYPSTIMRYYAAIANLLGHVVEKEVYATPRFVQDVDAPRKSDSDSLRTVYRTITVAPEVMIPLRALAKRESTSINSILTAVLSVVLRTLLDSDEKRPISIKSSLDLRKRLRTPVSYNVVGYFAGNVGSKHALDTIPLLPQSGSNKDFIAKIIALARADHQQVHDTINNGTALRDNCAWIGAKDLFQRAVAGHLLGNAKKAQQQHVLQSPSTFLTSNVGEIGPLFTACDDAAIVPVKCCFCSSVNVWQALEVTACSVNGRAQLVATAPSFHNTIDECGATLDGMLALTSSVLQVLSVS